MREYTYIAKDDSGKTYRDDIFARSEKEAIDKLHRRNLTIIRLDIVKQRSLYDRLFRTVRTELKVLIFRQMSAMLSAGIPMLRVLNALRRNEGMPPHFQRALQEIYSQVTSGYTLSQSLRLFPQYFSAFMIGSIRIGEASGQLPKTISHCGEYLNREYSYNLKLRQAMIYPTVLLTSLSLLMVFCFTYMIPIFLSLFEETQLQMPWPTRLLMQTTDFLRIHGLHIFLTAIGPLSFGIYAFYRWCRTIKGHMALERFMLKIPWYGHQVHLRMQSTYLRSLGTLIDSAVPLLVSLNLLTESMDYELLRSVAREQVRAISKGDNLTASMRRSGFFQPLTLEMVRIGEEVASVPQTMHRLASTLDEEMSLGLQLLSKLIEPIVLGILGLGVTFILLAVFLPIYSLAQSF